jgi:hypothetical protein
MVCYSKPWDTHNMPWESWDAMGIALVAKGNPINSMGCPMENHGALQQAIGNPQYAMGIMGRHGDYACRHGKCDKSMVYQMGNMGVLQQAVGRRIRCHNTYTTLMTPWEDSIVLPIESRRHIPAAASHILSSRSQSYLND